MTTEDLMKLADAYAETMYLRQDRYEARQALLDALEALGREVARMTACINTANSNHEEFERKWYLACDERDQARAELAAIRAQEPPSNPAMKITVRNKDWTVDYLSLPVGEHELFTKNYVYNASPTAKDAVLVADAARYRWLRDQIYVDEDKRLRIARTYLIADQAKTFQERLDAAIDAAMLAASPKLGGV